MAWDLLSLLCIFEYSIKFTQISLDSDSFTELLKGLFDCYVRKVKHKVTTARKSIKKRFHEYVVKF